MVDKSLEEIKSYFEKAKEEYKKQLFSFEDDLNYYKEFLQLIGKTEDDALLEVKNCKDYLKCRKILNGRQDECKKVCGYFGDSFYFINRMWGRRKIRC
jgi:hypothetical protein